MTNLEDVIKVSQKELQSLFSKPRCTSKLLAKPPFRFLHDVVTAILKATSFPENYFSSSELDSKHFTSKHIKIDFMEKLISLVNVCRDITLEARPSKVVAGLEPIHTNILLIELARAATDSSLDRIRAINECLQKYNYHPASTKVEVERAHDTKRSPKPKKTPEQINNKHEKLTNDNEIRKKDKDTPLYKKDATNMSSSLRNSTTTTQQEELLKEHIASCNHDISRTRQEMEKIVSKPRCTEKLLNKPPFRFLHDLFLAVMRDTDFGLDILTETEKDSSNLKEKASKISFLQKIINHVEAALNENIDIDPVKIISGLESGKTCCFLQMFAIAAVSHKNKRQDAKNVQQQPIVKESKETPTFDEPSTTHRQGNREENSEEKEPTDAHEQQQLDSIVLGESKRNDIDGENNNNKNTLLVQSTQNNQDISVCVIDGKQSIEDRINNCNSDKICTCEMVSTIVTKPRCTEKLLTKPPFRFLHDLIMAIGRNTNFSLNMLSQSEKISANIKDKHEKIAFLNKIIESIESILDVKIEARPAKIVSGLEPEKTCHFLQLLAVAATIKDKNDHKSRNEQQNVSSPKSSENVEKETLHTIENQVQDMAVERDDAVLSNEEKVESIDQKDSFDPNSNINERDNIVDIQVDEETRSLNKENSQQNEKLLNNLGGSEEDEAKEESIHITSFQLKYKVHHCNSDHNQTREMMETITSKPRCTDKLLGKPPFRFLHDLIIAVINKTGFGIDVYSDEEKVSSNVREKVEKIAFLDKIIKLVEDTLRISIEARSSKIVSGLDPEQTCKFLQLLVVATTTEPNEDRSDENEKANLQNQINSFTDNEVTNTVGAMDFFLEDGKNLKEEEKENVEGIMPMIEFQPKNPASMRPTTARRRPPRIKKEDTKISHNVMSSQRIINIIKDEDGSSDVDKTSEEDAFNRGDKIKTNSRGVSFEEITPLDSHYAIGNMPEHERKENSNQETNPNDQEDKPGIRLKFNLSKNRSKPILPSQNLVATKNAKSIVDIEQLTNAIQQVVQHTVTAGRYMDHVQVDVAQMMKERNSWKAELRQNIEYMDKKKSQFQNSSLDPLRQDLSLLDDQVKEKIQRVEELRCTIFQNDKKIKRLLRLVIGSK